MNKTDPADWCIIFRRAKCQDTLDTMVGGAVRKSESAAELGAIILGGSRREEELRLSGQ